MKNKKFYRKCLQSAAAALLASSLMFPNGTYSGIAPVYAQTLQEQVQPDGTVIVEIASVEEFQEFAKKCRYDTWSLGKIIRLNADLDLSDIDFEGVPYLNGVFDGNGHTVSHVKLQEDGSNYGFFRYVGAAGVVQNLNVEGSITATGSQQQLGGIAGVNQGMIVRCSFKGRIEGRENVGGIVGENRRGGSIAASSSNAVIAGMESTGGIAGNNEGLLTECFSESNVNTDELKTTMDLGGVDIGTLNLASNVLTRQNLGGIAGSSNGIISSCTNQGTVGYAHMGYNVGGIAGIQSGTITSCTNEGDILGRKDIGGIVGQASPYVESEYLSDEVEQTRQELGSLSDTIGNITSALQGTSESAKNGRQALQSLYDSSIRQVEASLSTLSAKAGSYGEEASAYIQNAQSALSQLQSVTGAGESVTQTQLSDAKQSLTVIQDNLTQLGNIFQNAQSTAEEELAGTARQLKANLESSKRSVDQVVQSVQNGLNAVGSNVRSATEQMSQMADNMDENLGLLTSGTLTEDVSSAEHAQDMNGVIDSCLNSGSLKADLNVGGIAGTMNIESDFDPETDLDMTGMMNVTLRSVVNAVVLNCANYGSISSKKNNAGGITGLQELGLIYSCEGYGKVSSESGRNLGGIAGKSTSTVRGSYSHCRVQGTDFVGGICGSGYAMTDNISIGTVDGNGQNHGGIAGERAEEGDVLGNLFVGEGIGGIDGISYAGAADEVTYEQVLALDHIPEGFLKVTIAFYADGKYLETTVAPYGGMLTEDYLLSLKIPEKKGYYASWPEELTSQPIKENLTVEAQYNKWTQSVASKEKEGNHSLVLMKGEFYQDTALQLEKVKGPEGKGDVAYAYQWSLTGTKDQAYDSLEGHFYKTSGSAACEVWYLDGNTWKKAKTTEDGSYLTAKIPAGADIALVETSDNTIMYMVFGGLTALAVVIALAAIVRKRKKKQD